MKSILTAAALALALPFGFAALPASAQTPAKADMGLPVGAAIPAVAGTTQEGAPVTFETLKGEKGMVLAFFRSADWCPYCKGQLKDLQMVADALKAEGYPLAALSYDPVDTLKSFSDKNGLSYTLLSDPESKVIDAFGVRNEEMRGKKRFDGIPNPAIFIISADGKVQAKLYEEGYKNRPPGTLVLQTVKGLGN
jgi:peroxiredoxin